MEEPTKSTESVPEAECDLVMRGGVTSGAVYPSALWEISKHYKLRNVGGASAGAIAAAGAAACEFGRRKDPTAFDRLEDVTARIPEQGFVRNLFQPKEETRLAFDVGVKAVSRREEKYPRRVLRAVANILGRRTRSLVQGVISLVVLAAAVAATAVALAGGPTWLGVIGLVLLAVVALVGVVLVVAALALRGFAMELNSALVEGGFGLCTGRTESGYPQDSGLTDWLHKTIQTCAGKPDAEPLTFRDLLVDQKEPQVSFQLVTTDLSASRPVVLPLVSADPDDQYLFEEGELRRLFPDAVFGHLKRHGGDPLTFEEEPGKTFYRFPGLDLPIVVAARLSLSFPVLMETVPLWMKDPNGVPVRHLMSDGGISSNFPIHFFDSLLPARPTFGLDLQPLRGSAERVVMSPDRRQPLFETVSDLATFGIQIVNAARNWRDNMQTELAGYRDRVCQIRLDKDQGGLNLEMGPPVVENLIATGRDAGRLIVRTATEAWWDEHRLTRYWTLMQMLQSKLGRGGVGRNCVYRKLEGMECRGVPFRDRLSAYAETGTRGDIDPSWCRTAIPASDVFISVAALLGAGGAIDFDEGAPTPTPTMRIVPTV